LPRFALLFLPVYVNQYSLLTIYTKNTGSDSRQCLSEP
jgi:hypothetical protein